MPHTPNETDLPTYEEAFRNQHVIPDLESVYKIHGMAAYATATTEHQRISKLRVLAFLLIYPLSRAGLSEVIRSVKRCFDNRNSTPPL